MTSATPTTATSAKEDPTGFRDLQPLIEDALAIAKEIESGCKTGDVLVELDRAVAIAHAIKAARAGDTVLIAGKGHESYQIVGTARHRFSDVEHAQQALAARGVADV